MQFARTVKLFAHRGAKLVAPENSKPAFELAYFQGVDGFECDIQLSKDGIPVLWHDDEMDRIGLPNKRIDMFSWDDLQLLDISMLCSNYNKFCGILSLEEYLEAYFGKTILLLELKQFDDEPLEHHHLKIRTTVELVTRKLRQNPKAAVYLSCFDYPTLDFAHAINSSLNYIANSEDIKTSEELKTLFNKHPYLKGICLEKKCVNPEITCCAKSLNLLSLVYTCNDSETANKLKEDGIEIIISDCPNEL